MACERYVVVRLADEARWLVRKGGETYGEYLSEDSAIEDALDAAQDAGLRGAEAQVLVEDPNGRTSLEWRFGAGRLHPVLA